MLVGTVLSDYVHVLGVRLWKSVHLGSEEQKHTHTHTHTHKHTHKQKHAEDVRHTTVVLRWKNKRTSSARSVVSAVNGELFRLGAHYITAGSPTATAAYEMKNIIVRFTTSPLFPSVPYLSRKTEP